MNMQPVFGSGFCPVLDAMLSDKKTIGRSGKVIQHLEANSTLNNLHFIQRTMRERKPERTLEIGLAYGASALVFCAEHQRLGHQPSRQHTAIDPYQPFQLFDDAGVLALERAGLASFLDFRPEFSELALPRLLEARQNYDFIYVDGSHLFENVLIDAFYCARLLSDHGIIAFDDSTDPHVAKVMGFIRSNLVGALKEIQPSDVRTTVARFLNRRQLTVFERLPHAGEPRAWDTPLREWDAKLGPF